MILNFDAMDLTLLEKFYGGEKAVQAKMHVDEHNKIMRSVLEPGASVGYHTHETSSEIMYFLSGTGKVLCDGVWERVTPGTCHYCPRGSSHTLINDGTEDLVTFAVVPEHTK